ncbi:MAG: hypothetical protein Q9162_001006 [Coniocarpon cinnabarinum]
MPVTIKVAEHQSSPARLPKCALETPHELLERLPNDNHGTYAKNCEAVLEGSIYDIHPSKCIYASTEGLVGTAIKAYNEHLHLILRSDDVWILSFYVNAHSEELRGLFVEHEGKKELKIVVQKQPYGHFEKFISLMSKRIEEEIVDGSFREWLMPEFSTTLPNDRTVCSVILMGTLKNYFSYTCSLECGIPTVTLMGEKSDWELLRSKLWRLGTLGEEPSIWSKQLDKVVTGMISTFDGDKASEAVSFWSKIAHYNDHMSGSEYYQGWITGFCFWSNSGKRLYHGSRCGGLELNGVRFAALETSGMFSYFDVECGRQGKSQRICA